MQKVRAPPGKHAQHAGVVNVDTPTKGMPRASELTVGGGHGVRVMRPRAGGGKEAGGTSSFPMLSGTRLTSNTFPHGVNKKPARCAGICYVHQCEAVSLRRYVERRLCKQGSTLYVQ